MNNELKPEELELLSAYADGELSTADRQDVELQLEQRPEWRSALAELMALHDLFQKLPSQSLPGQFLDRVMSSAERTMLLGERAAAQGSTSHKFWKLLGPKTWLVTALAASVLVVLLIPAWYRSARLAQAPPQGPPPGDGFALGRETESGLPAGVDRAAATDKESPPSSDPMLTARGRVAASRRADDAAPLVNRPHVVQPLPTAGTGIQRSTTRPIDDRDNSKSAGREVVSGKPVEFPEFVPPAADESPGDDDQRAARLGQETMAATNEILIEVQLAARIAGSKAQQPADAVDQIVNREQKQRLGLAESAPDQDRQSQEQVAVAETDSPPPASAIQQDVNRAEIVAVETSLEEAGEILSDLVRNGAVLRDLPLSPELSKRLGWQFRVNQLLTPDQRRQTSFGSSAAEAVPTSAQFEVMNVVQARAQVAAQGGRGAGQGRTAANVVIVNPVLPQEWQTHADAPPGPSGATQLSNLALSHAVEAAQRRQQFDGSRSPLPMAANEPRTAPPIEGAAAQTDRPVRMYLWVRETPGHAMPETPRP